jgi:hypothetical protein
MMEKFLVKRWESVGDTEKRQLINGWIRGLEIVIISQIHRNKVTNSMEVEYG